MRPRRNLRNRLLLGLLLLGVPLVGCPPNPPELGVQHTVVIFAAPDNPFGYPWPQDLPAAEGRFFTNGDSFAAWVEEASLGRATVEGDVYGPYILPQGASYYCPSTCINSRIRDDMIAAADPDIDFTKVRRIMLAIGGVTFGGEGAFGGAFGAPIAPIPTDEGVIQASVSWFDRTAVSMVSAIAHEFGHNMDGDHAGRIECGVRTSGPGGEFAGYSELFAAPGLPFDVAELGSGAWFFESGGSVQCELDTTGDPDDVLSYVASGAPHYSAFLKSKFHWLKPGQTHVISNRSGSPGTTQVSLEPIETAGSGTKEIRVPIWEGTNHFTFDPSTGVALDVELFHYSLEYRTPTGFDADAGTLGVLVRVADPIGAPFGFDTATFAPDRFVLTPGAIFADRTNDQDLEIEVLSMDASGAQVEIRRSPSDRMPTRGSIETVVLVAGPASPFGYPFTQDVPNLREKFFTDADSLSAWVADVSAGAAQLSGDVYGPYVLSEPYETYCSDAFTCNLSLLQGAVMSAADPDVDYSDVDLVMIVFAGVSNFYDTGNTRLDALQYIPSTDGGSIPRARVGFFDRTSAYAKSALAHEVGHLFGAEHAAEIACGTRDPAPSGEFSTYDEVLYAPPLPKSFGEVQDQEFFVSVPGGPATQCLATENQDDDDALGFDWTSRPHFAASWKSRFGWLGPDQRTEVSVRAGALGVPQQVWLQAVESQQGGVTWIDVPIHEGSLEFGHSPKLSREMLHYVLEYRRPVGFDADAGTDGVLVRIMDKADLPHGFRTMTFGPDPFVLSPGMLFVDRENGLDLRVEVLSMNATEAVVEVTLDLPPTE